MGFESADFVGCVLELMWDEVVGVDLQEQD
jgi:hypothetical protein